MTGQGLIFICVKPNFRVIHKNISDYISFMSHNVTEKKFAPGEASGCQAFSFYQNDKLI